MLSRRKFSRLAAGALGSLAVSLGWSDGAAAVAFTEKLWAAPAESPGDSPGTWLPAGKTSGRRLLACWYEGSKLVATRAFSQGGLRTASNRWVCEVRDVASDFEVTFRLVEGTADSSGVAVAFDFAHWSRNNYVLVPAVVYNGNRFHVLGGGYAPAYPQEMYFNPKLPLTISDNPRLSVEPGKASKIELLTGNAATPAMCFYAPGQKRAFILLTEQSTRFGNIGLFIEENAAQDKITFVVSAPGVRERAAGFGGFRPSGDVAADWKPGDTVTLKFRVYSFPANGISALLEKFMAVRKSLTGQNQPRNLVPMSKLGDTIVPRFKGRWMAWKTGRGTPGRVPTGPYYATSNSPDFGLGWTGGFMQTPLLAIDDSTERDHICQQFEFVVGKLQGKSGYFYAGITPEGQLLRDRPFDSRMPTLTRRNADTLLAFFKFFQILKAQGHGGLIKPAWEQSARSLAEAFVSTWNKSGEFGQYVDPATGEIAVYNSTGGATAPGGLALGARYFHEPEFLRVAQASADFYYQRDVLGLGLAGGACGDTSQDPVQNPPTVFCNR